jgi:putative MATE family efflux protein
MSGYDLTVGPVGAHLRRQALPFSVGLVAIFSFEAIDLYFIAQLGGAELAAVSFALPVIWLVYGIGIGLEAGVASCVSRAVGAREEQRARRLATDSAVLGVLVATALLLIGTPLIEPTFRLLGATDELLPIIREYMEVWYFVAPLDMALWCTLASIRARGNSLLESKIIIAAALLNLALDPIFIFGLFGFPRLEVAGAALATVVSTGIMLAFTLWHLGRRLGVLASPLARLATIVGSWRHMLQIGIPAMATNAIVPLSSAIVVSLIAAYGVGAVAGYGIAMRIEPMALVPFYALSAVSSPFFGQNIGGGHFERLREARRIITRFCLAFGFLLAAAASLAAPFITSWYTEDPAIAEITTGYIWLVAWSWGAYGLVMSVNASFNGSGRPLPAVVLSTARVIVVLLPLILIGRWLLGIWGIFAAILVSNGLLGGVAWWWLGRHINEAEARFSPRSPEPSPES